MCLATVALLVRFLGRQQYELVILQQMGPVASGGARVPVVAVHRDDQGIRSVSRWWRPHLIARGRDLGDAIVQKGPAGYGTSKRVQSSVEPPLPHV